MPVARPAKGIDRLFVMGWRGSLAAILIAFVVSFFLSGFWWPYWRIADMDLWMVYEAFLSNNGLRQEYFDHPGYLTILSLGTWFKWLHAFGLLSIHAISNLPVAFDGPDSGLAWMRATQAARLLSLLIALAFLTSFAFLLRCLVRDWRIAILSAFALAFSGGLMMEGRIVRTELLPAAFMYCGFLLLLLAARTQTSYRPLLVGLTSFLAALAMLNKVQFLLLILAFPPILVAFGHRFAQPITWQSRRNQFLLMIAYGAVAVLAAVLAWPIAQAGLFDAAAVSDRVRLFGTEFPFYQVLIGVWILGWMLTYAIMFGVGWAETVSAMAAMIAGAGLGLLVLMLRYDVHNAVVVINPFEKMLLFAKTSDAGLLQDGTMDGGAFVQSLLSGVGLLLTRLTFVLNSSPRPTIFLEWVVIAGAVFAWRRGERKVVFQVALLLAAASAIDLLGTLRGLKLEYFIVTDPLVIIAAAWLLARVPSLLMHRWVLPVGLTLMIATICVGLAEPVKHDFENDIPLSFCVPHHYYTRRVVGFSFCPWALPVPIDPVAAESASGAH
ncbi:MAG TPA: hypothetical protein VL402_06320 [Xanthobacteraceae bacterium]|jgi:hypothetical protein|nr:hypothetical protein [Xanthobacteraceae bacterium]